MDTECELDIEKGGIILKGRNGFLRKGMIRIMEGGEKILKEFQVIQFSPESILRLIGIRYTKCNFNLIDSEISSWMQVVC